LRGALPGFRVPLPAGGWFVWLRLPEPMTASALLRAGEQRGVSFVEGTRFYPGGQHDSEHIRLCFSLLSTQELAEAASRLASAVTALGR
jgi:2-aminoadipate transaminase